LVFYSFYLDVLDAGFDCQVRPHAHGVIWIGLISGFLVAQLPQENMEKVCMDGYQGLVIGLDSLIVYVIAYL